MVDINYQNLPPQEGFKVDVREMDAFSPHPESEEDESEEGPNPPSYLGRAFGSNEFHITYIEMEPDELLPWHTHTPIQHQIYMPLEGTVRVKYVDNDGEEHSVDAEPFQLVYLPAGAHNQIENAGDDTLKLQVIERETLIPRVEHIVGESEDLYDPKNDPKYALEIDTLRGEVLQRQEQATERY